MNTLRPRSEWRTGLDFDALLAEMDAAVKTPGFQAAWTMPIKARVDMLTTGIRTPIGIKVFGTDLGQILEENRELQDEIDDVSVVYVPLYATGCVFQGVQRQEEVRKGGK